MRATIGDNPLRATRRAAAAAACAVAIGLIGAGSASAQSGGVGSPGGTAPDPAAPAPTPTPSAATGQVFPLPGPHTIGQGFGAARSGHSHQGQDIFAPCGAPEVAVSQARVIRIATQRAAGNYVVIRNAALHQDYVYAHLATPAPVTKGQIVTPGQQIGTVGQTGNARGCHLHFELWVGKYYRGGHPVNPLPFLQTWDAIS